VFQENSQSSKLEIETKCFVFVTSQRREEGRKLTTEEIEKRVIRRKGFKETQSGAVLSHLKILPPPLLFTYCPFNHTTFHFELVGHAASWAITMLRGVESNVGKAKRLGKQKQKPKKKKKAAW
jgi:hypothetical protein